MKRTLKGTTLLTLLFILTTLCLGVSAEAASQVNGYNRFSHTSYSLDWGIKTFNYRTDYIGQVITGYEVGSTYKAVTDQDFVAYKVPEDAIWPPEIGNGMIELSGVYLLNTNNTVKDSQDSSYWSNGSIYSRYFPGGTFMFLSKKSYYWLEGRPSETFRVKVVTLFALPSYLLNST